eukprot:5424756-Karenia_brevis.AAC.1
MPSLTQEGSARNGGFDLDHQYRLEEVLLVLCRLITKSFLNMKYSSNKKFQNFTKSQATGLMLSTGNLSTWGDSHTS